MSAYVVCKQEGNCIETVHTAGHSAGTVISRQFDYYTGDSVGGLSFKENVRRPLGGATNQVPVLSSRQVMDDTHTSTYSDCRLTASNASGKKRKSVKSQTSGACNDETQAAAAGNAAYDPANVVSTSDPGLGPAPGGGGAPASGPPRRAANARERDRTYSVNSAFTTLRTLIPTEPADRKLSKIETIRLATSYIAHLQTVLTVGLDEVDQPCMILRQRASASVPEETSQASISPTHICTFCLSASKTKQQLGAALSTAAAAAGHGHHPSPSLTNGPGASCMYSYVNTYG